MIKKVFIFAIALFAASTSYAGIYNNGATIVVTSGTSVVVGGDLVATDAVAPGLIDNNGSIYVSGHITNNSTGNMFTNITNVGLLTLNGTGAQVIGGSQRINFENLAIDASSIPNLTTPATVNNISLPSAATPVTIQRELRVDGTISGPRLIHPDGAYLSMLPTANVPLVYPISNGAHDLSLTLTTSSQLTSRFRVKLNDQSDLPGANSISFWDISCNEVFANATIKFHIAKSALKSGSLQSNQFRYFDYLNNRYKIIPPSQITTTNSTEFVEVTITGLGSEIVTQID